MSQEVLEKAPSERPFDLMALGDDHRADPYGTYRKLRDEMPVVQNPDGSWVVTRHKDVQTVLTSNDTTTDKSEQLKKALGDGPICEFQLTAMTTWDPPDHTHLRRSLNKAFTPKALAQWQPLVESAVQELLDGFDANGEMDLVNDFAALLPLTLICKMLGVPTTNKDRFRAWAGSITTSLEPTVTPQIVADADRHAEEWKEYFRGLIAERRKEPGNDIISMLLRTDESDKPFPELVHLHNIALLLSAGHETTTSLITSGVDLFFQHPEQAEMLRRDPSLVDLAVEEVLRYESPVQMGVRRTTAPMTLSGVTIPTNAIVWTLQGAANRDEREFKDPDVFDITRKPNRHMAFASGIHTCLGAPLARMEARVALKRLICDYPNMRQSGPPERLLRTRYRAFQSYPVSVS